MSTSNLNYEIAVYSTRYLLRMLHNLDLYEDLYDWVGISEIRTYTRNYSLFKWSLSEKR